MARSASRTGNACAHLLAEQGKLDLHAPVAAYWPEFARRGKEGIATRMVLAHTAGIPLAGRQLTFEELTRWTPVIRAPRPGAERTAAVGRPRWGGRTLRCPPHRGGVTGRRSRFRRLSPPGPRGTRTAPGGAAVRRYGRRPSTAGGGTP
ncbi:serine hydrolase domain-containing protein [Streptomyces sp. C10]|uniref:serine hydrolase domain-containing protein n=1 Tax=Streptomyces sp. C10 TaxID=531941 RepID=UPI00398083C1